MAQERGLAECEDDEYPLEPRRGGREPRRVRDKWDKAVLVVFLGLTSLFFIGFFTAMFVSIFREQKPINLEEGLRGHHGRLLMNA